MSKKKSPDIPMYQEMKDTPWITQARDMANRGYQGIIDNYNKVNVFSEPTQQSLQARVNALYNRAEGDFDRTYRETMNKMANRNYSQFGTLNATPAAYRTDMENLSQQRKLADLSYNKALYYDQAVNNELQRRYNTLNMFNNLYQKGEVPYQQDVSNWKLRNENLDRQYYNDLGNSQSGFNWGDFATGALKGAATGFLTTGNPWGAVAGGALGGLGGGFGNA